MDVVVEALPGKSSVRQSTTEESTLKVQAPHMSETHGTRHILDKKTFSTLVVTLDIISPVPISTVTGSTVETQPSSTNSEKSVTETGPSPVIFRTIGFFSSRHGLKPDVLP